MMSRLLKAHYEATFRQFGATPRGVDWEGSDKARLRHEAMLRLIAPQEISGRRAISLLDVGCGYGALLEFLTAHGFTNVDYTGVDLVDDMVAHANRQLTGATFVQGDILEMDLADGSYDYVIANGVFTQKLMASDAEMHAFLSRMVEKLFALCRKGVAFNVMTKFVDFESFENYYRHPGEMADLASRLTRRFVIDHSYPLYEYTVRLYK